MADNELLIKLNADAKNAKKAFDDVKAQTEDLRDTLGEAAKVGAVGLAALGAAAVMSVREFEHAQQSVRELNNVLQNQGVYTDALSQKYQAIADQIERKTGIEAEQVQQAQAVAQGILGQTEVTEKLTNAIVNLAAAKKTDLASAATIVAKTIGTGTNALAREGLELKATATQSEKYAETLKFLELRYNNAAEAANKGFNASLKEAGHQIGNIAENVGQKLQPTFEGVMKVAANLFGMLAKSEAFTDMAIAVGAGAAAFSAILVIVPLLVIGFANLTASAAALGITLNASMLGIPVAIAAVVAGVTWLVLNWDKAWAAIQATTKAGVTFVSEVLGGLGKILQAAFTLDASKLDEGLAQLKGSLAKTSEIFKQTYAEQSKVQNEEQEKQDAAKKKAADKEAADKRFHQNLLAQIEKQGQQMLLEQQRGASAAYMDLRKQELDTLKALEASKTEIEKQAYTSRVELLRSQIDTQRREDLQRSIAFEIEKQAALNELQAEGMQLQYDLSIQQQEQLQAQLLTERDVEQNIENEKLQIRIAARNQELIERKKYGEAVAVIDRVLNSQAVQGARSAAGELVALQQSKNAQLKEIGKAAALAQIAIATPESAMNIYKGFSTIPIIGPALGIAGAAAAVAFGAEQASQVLGVAKGGLIEGGITGRDSVPAMLMPGELVVPTRNYDQVVGAVADQGNMPEVISRLDDLIAAVANIQGGNNFEINGDVLADDAFIPALVQKISDFLEYRNGKMFGVTA